MDHFKLDKIVTLQAKTMSTDDYGGPVETWADYARIWAKYRELRGRELFAAQAAQSETTAMFYVRYASYIVPSMRIIKDGKPYDITAVVDIDGKNVEMEISAKTGLSEG